MAQGMSKTEAEAAVKAATSKAGSSWFSKMFGKAGGGASAGMIFTPQDISPKQRAWETIGIMKAGGTKKTDAEWAAYEKQLIDKYSSEWGLMENPIEYFKQQTKTSAVSQLLHAGGINTLWDQNVQTKDTSKDWFLGLDLSTLFGKGQDTTEEQATSIATKVAAAVPVNQNITVTFVIQGDMTPETGTTSVDALSNFLKAYAKGNTPGGAS